MLAWEPRFVPVASDSMTFIIILKIVDMTMGVRASEPDEIEGLDLSRHDEEGYSLEG
jgi:ammonia channel protein AmtB